MALLVPAGQPVVVAIDDTLFERRGKRIWAASWFHDGSAPEPAKTGYGNNWVVAAVIVRLPMISRPVAWRNRAAVPPGPGWTSSWRQSPSLLPSLQLAAPHNPCRTSRRYRNPT